MTNTTLASIALEHLPIAICVLQERIITECNAPFAELFGGTRAQLIGQTIEPLFPSQRDFEWIGQRVYSALTHNEYYQDERMMRNLQGQVFWCRVRGKTLDRTNPSHTSVWTWGLVHPSNPLVQSLSQRERDILAYVSQGLTNKLIARELGISHRTVEMHRARLLKKAGVQNTHQLLRLFHS